MGTMEGTLLLELLKQEDSTAAYEFMQTVTEGWLTQEQEQQQTKDVILHYVVKKFLPDDHAKKAIGPNRDHFQIQLANVFGVQKSALCKHIDMKDFEKNMKAVDEQSPELLLELEEATQATTRNDDEGALDETGSGVEADDEASA